jgi:hypothetical protein
MKNVEPRGAGRMSLEFLPPSASVSSCLALYVHSHESDDGEASSNKEVDEGPDAVEVLKADAKKHLPSTPKSAPEPKPSKKRKDEPKQKKKKKKKKDRETSEVALDKHKEAMKKYKLNSSRKRVKQGRRLHVKNKKNLI